jgi:hypothetical protein
MLVIFPNAIAYRLGFPLDVTQKATKQIPWPESASELYRPSDRRLSAKLMSTFADREMSRSAVDPLRPYYYSFFQVAPQLCARGLVDPVPNPLLVRKSGSAGNRTSL